MLCEKCKKAEATTHIRQNINGEVAEMNLCENCAAELTGGFENHYGKLFSDFGFVFFPPVILCTLPCAAGLGIMELNDFL